MEIQPWQHLCYGFNYSDTNRHGIPLSCIIQTLWVCNDFMRSNFWTPSLLYSWLPYCTWHPTSQSFLTRPESSYSLSAPLTPSLCLFCSLQEEAFLWFLSVCPYVRRCWHGCVAFIVIQMWESFGQDELGHSNLNLGLSHSLQTLADTHRTSTVDVLQWKGTHT